MGFRSIILCSVSALTFSASGAYAQDAEDVGTASAPGQKVIVVTATRSEMELRDAPASMSVVTGEDLELTAASDVLDAVRQTASVSFQGRGVGGRQVLSIRGMGSDQTLFLIDGRRSLGTDNVFGHSDFEYNWLPVNAIERIEVVRGPLSALYGSDALGGVVNIITKGAPEKWTASATARYGIVDGKGDEWMAGVQGAGPLAGDTVGAVLSYTYARTDDIPLAEDTRVSELEGRKAHNLHGRVTLKPSPDHRIDFDVAYVDEWRDRFTTSGTTVYEASYDLDKLQYGASWFGEFGEFDTQLNLYHHEFDQTNFATKGITPSTPQNLAENVVDGRVALPVLAGHRLTLGGEYRTETLENAALSGGKGSIDYSGVFVQDEWRLADSFLVTLGGRYDRHESFGSEFSPRIYAVYHLSDQLSLKGGYGHGFRAPTLKQSSPNYLYVGPHSFIGNADIGPETSDNYEISASFTSSRARASITGFYNDVSDLIVSSCIQNCSLRLGRLYTYVNLDKTRTRGIEVEGDLDFTDTLGLRGSYTYLDTENRGTGKQLPERPRHALNARLQWQLRDPGLTVALRAEYIGHAVSYTTAGAVLDLPSYALWHANGAWKVNQNVTLNFGVENLADTRLAEKSANYGFATRPRTFYLGLRAGF